MSQGKQLGGFFILEAQDMKQAVSLISQHPGLAVGPFEIRPIDEELIPNGRRLIAR